MKDFPVKYAFAMLRGAIAGIAVTAILFWLAVSFPLPNIPALYAQTAGDMMAQIITLRAQISLLQEELAVLSSEASKSAPLFARNLGAGERGEDVRELQIFLNSSSETRLATYGPGSPGSETPYFGRLTASAVERFQELFAPEILAPSGLSLGTGYVGPSTRAKLNALYAERADSTEAVRADPASLESGLAGALTEEEVTFMRYSLPVSDGLLVTFPSAYFGPVGMEVALYGAGFSSVGNDIHFGSSYVLRGVRTSDPSILSFVVPRDFPLGYYEIWVTNENGKSNDGAFFVITDPSTSAPEIVRISPVAVSVGKQVTLYGSGFTRVGNMVRTSYAIIENVPSPDGKTLVFEVTPPFLADLPEAARGQVQLELWVYIVNANGVSGTGRFMVAY
ncbi:MAG: hypothetical protein BMS9Abin13_594 [Patescibacteria group bacterium]|nr:MAG: hypothetical protein BMS9Abin13_594 [Patescibacteria group bacterium]